MFKFRLDNRPVQILDRYPANTGAAQYLFSNYVNQLYREGKFNEVIIAAKTALAYKEQNPGPTDAYSRKWTDDICSVVVDAVRQIGSSDAAKEIIDDYRKRWHEGGLAGFKKAFEDLISTEN